jgi:hypothetical protein
MKWQSRKKRSLLLQCDDTAMCVACNSNPQRTRVSILMHSTNRSNNPFQYPSGFYPSPLSYHYKPHVLSARFNPRWAWHKLPWSVCRLSISLFAHTASLLASLAIYKRMMTKETIPQHVTSVLSTAHCYLYNNCLERTSYNTCLLYLCVSTYGLNFSRHILNPLFVTLRYTLQLLFVYR